LLPVLYAVTLFVGAALLFLVQPLVGKLLLPLVGGSPGVWNTCMVFFQVVLLGGYLYAHRATGTLGVRRQALFHLLLLAAVLISFKVALATTGSPVAVPVSLLPSDQDYPVFGLAALLGIAVGVPFFVLSTTSPLLQRWFAATGHPAARDPYFLYAASNAGSLLGLLGYPFLIEPTLTLHQQQWVFAGGVVGYIALVLVCASTIIRPGPNGSHGCLAQRGVSSSLSPALREEGRGEGREFHDAGSLTPSSMPDSSELDNPQPPLANSRIARWVLLAALPSSLLLGVTTHVSTDLAPVPLLWVVPLALYLLSFILVFARWPDGLHRLVGRFTPVLILFVVLSLLMSAAEPFGLVAALHLGAFFGVCLVCHGELARDRPPPEHLTAFYFWMSLGGVIGGMFNALIAPIIFHKLGMVEYPLALVLAAMVRPRGHESGNGSRLCVVDVLLVLLLLIISVGLVLAVPKFVVLPSEPNDPDMLSARLLRGGLMFGLPSVAAFALVRRPARYALSLAALFVAGAFDRGQLGETVHMERNFFGVVRVTRSADGKFVQLIHGTTLHGKQRTDEGDQPRPMTYYHPRGPVGKLFEALDKLPPERVRNVGLVGLGTGAMSYYAKPGQHWTFFEIDPAVARIARDHFHFLSHCEKRGVECDVILGDARRQLARIPDGHFDLIILDGFCSDAIPVHLLTREAFQLYLQKLAPRGVLAVHISNNHLDLPPLVARIARHEIEPPLSVRYSHDMASEDERADGKSDSQWMVLARSDADLGRMATHAYWEKLPDVDGPIWRDDFANLLKVWKKRAED
jgi:protein-L-isoaspartate O-methyltransferase